MKFLQLCLIGTVGLTAWAQDLDRGIDSYRKGNFSESALELRKVVERCGPCEALLMQVGDGMIRSAAR
jgi:hypothetical protein